MPNVRCTLHGLTAYTGFGGGLRGLEFLTDTHGHKKKELPVVVYNVQIA